MSALYEPGDRAIMPYTQRTIMETQTGFSHCPGWTPSPPLCGRERVLRPRHRRGLGFPEDVPDGVFQLGGAVGEVPGR